MILDLGAQSTRPGSERVTEEEELNRLLTALEALSKEFPEAFISVEVVMILLRYNILKKSVQKITSASI